MLLSTSQETVRVLHVEDEPDFAELTADMLEVIDNRFAVETVNNPRDGLDHLDEVECIVSDYEMPRMNGIEFLETIREKRPDLPFILFTGKGSEEIAGEAISAGVTDYLQKTGRREQYRLLATRIDNAVTQYRTEQRTSRAFSAIESATEGISFLDEDGEFVYVNDAYAEMLGYEPQDLLGTHWEALYPDDAVPRVYSDVLPQARHGGWHGTTEMLCKDGSVLTVEHKLTYAEDRTLICTISEPEDAAALKEQLSLRERAMDEAPVGITVTDPSQPDNPIIYANDGFTELTGYPREEIVGENCRFLQGPETREEPVAAMREAIEAEEPVTVELRNYRKNGELFWNRVWITPLRDDDGTVTNYVGFQEDVTERVETNQDLEAQNERLEEFASIVSHDLRTPLDVASSRLELAQEACDSPQLAAVADAHERMERLIDDLLTLARHGETVREMEGVSLRELIEYCWESIETVGTTLNVDTDLTIRADRNRLEQAVENLLRNAVEHGGSDVKIRVGELADRRGFYVADDGPGIPADAHDEVFESGYSTTEEGTGLGLAIIREIVGAHDWEISVTDSEIGGARFEIADVEIVE